ncbi:MAG: hypothetical protein SOR59_00920 [Lachnospiraceae bacterium]|nr:hypothetical protein [Lachnospiraceae bacterium]MDY2956160.1 hypothetical protein [Lachnospiraceae bacterium]
MEKLNTMTEDEIMVCDGGVYHPNGGCTPTIEIPILRPQRPKTRDIFDSALKSLYK